MYNSAMKLSKFSLRVIIMKCPAMACHSFIHPLHILQQQSFQLGAQCIILVLVCMLYYDNYTITADMAFCCPVQPLVSPDAHHTTSVIPYSVATC